ncbi:hypothetical protein WJX75_008184 [Coccomyxa subellipsoidea]|uniref:Uncharacterized protein n=1 Tax=Coccomyxa subellipsoidea TaxID=248742 RepID=A0ABR2YDF2_9CHLO
MMLRPKGSDVDTLVHMIDEYSEFLAILPWAPTTILEGGGNMGVATVLLAHMYPAATIVTLEPNPGNCWLLKANTAPFPNVHVECTGLWDKDANLKILAATSAWALDCAWALACIYDKRC